MNDDRPLWGELRAERAEDRAEGVLTARELHEIDTEGRSARGYVQDEYGLDAMDYDSEDELHAAVRAADAGPGRESGQIEAEDVLSARDLQAISDRGQTPCQYLKAEYGIVLRRYDNRQEVVKAMNSRDS